MTTHLTAHVLGLFLTFAAAGCDNPANAAGPRAKPAQTSRAAESASATKITKIVFVGKQNACDCTRKRVDAGWAALQKVLGTPPKVPVERLHIDTEGDKVAPYRNQKPIMALPAIYFLDGKNAVLEMLQGEIAEAQITAALKR